MRFIVTTAEEESQTLWSFTHLKTRTPESSLHKCSMTNLQKKCIYCKTDPIKFFWELHLLFVQVSMQRQRSIKKDVSMTPSKKHANFQQRNHKGKQINWFKGRYLKVRIKKKWNKYIKMHVWNLGNKGDHCIRRAGQGEEAIANTYATKIETLNHIK